MRISDVLREVGHPVAYYPGLARYLGGVKATVLFCQIFYWQDKATSELGVHKSTEELEAETGLSYEEQRAARKALKRVGVLIETERRIEHKIYFRIDDDALERLVTSTDDESAPVDTQVGKVHSPKWEKSISGNGKSPSRELGKVQSAKSGKSIPPDGETLAREQGFGHLVNGVKTTAETTAATRASGAVDNSAAAAADLTIEPPNTEGDLRDLLIDLERKRGKELIIDRTRDRVYVLAWVGKGVTVDQLRAAHAAAVAARKRDSDDRPTYVGFVTTFIDEALAPSPAACAATEPGEWYRSPEGVDARGAELSQRPRKPDEDWRYYRVLVAKASREPRAIEFVLSDAQRFNQVDLYQLARKTFGAALMPVDDYAS